MGDRADELFSLYIRTRDNWTCQRCHKHWPQIPKYRLHCSHFKSRGREATRFELLNCDTMCDDCHDYLGHHPKAHEAWQVARKGQDVVDWLIRQSNGYQKRDRKSERAIWRARLRDEFGITA